MTHINYLRIGEQKEKRLREDQIRVAEAPFRRFRFPEDYAILPIEELHEQFEHVKFRPYQHQEGSEHFLPRPNVDLVNLLLEYSAEGDNPVFLSFGKAGSWFQSKLLGSGQWNNLHETTALALAFQGYKLSVLPSPSPDFWGWRYTLERRNSSKASDESFKNVPPEVIPF